MGLAVINNTNETQTGNIDNQTWNFAQLEVDYLNLKKSTLKAKGATHINSRQTNEINFFFDIYYSRLNAVIASGHAILKGESGSELSNLLRQAEQHRNFLTNQVDTLLFTEKAALDEIVSSLEEFHPTVRKIAVDALQIITSQAEQERKRQEIFTQRFFLIAAAQLLVLAVIALTSNYLLAQVSGQKASLKHALDEAIWAKNSQKRFLDLMSHEMKTPLHGIIASLDLIKIESLSHKDKGNIKIAKVSANSALAQVEDVLWLSKNDSQEFEKCQHETFDAKKVVEDIIVRAQLKVNNKDISLHFSCDSQDYYSSRIQDKFIIYSYKEGFVRAVSNLIDNSVKYTIRGSVSVSLSVYRNDRGDRELLFVVTDTGIGMSDAQQELMYEDFKRVLSGDVKRNEGTGIGLGIAKRAVESMGGALLHKSTVNLGSEFSFCIPAPAVDHLHCLDQSHPASKIDLTTPILNDWALVVDDHEINLKILIQMLQLCGFFVKAARNGHHALELCSHNRFALIILDIQMPGIDGLETAQRIRRLDFHQDTLILAVSANLSTYSSEQFSSAGIIAKIAKPFGLTDLRSVLIDIGLHVQNTDHNNDTGIVENFSISDLNDTSNNLSLLSSSMSSIELRDLLDRFYAEVGEVLDNIRASDSSSARAVHRIAGTASFLGFKSLHRYLVDLEMALISGDHVQFHESRIEAAALREEILLSRDSIMYR